jgi:sec-independent protein translocase protein TatB
MNIFGLGPLEIILILVIALIVFGPAKLPEIMGQVGKAITDFRRATSDLSDEFNRTIQAELQETRALIDETRSTVTGLQTSINSGISSTAASITAPSLTAPAPAPVSNGTNGTHTATETPPLADTAQWSWETSAAGTSTSAAAVAIEEPKVERKRTRADDLLPPY